ncbi:hypothetical protein [Clostridium perfringens]|uniref:Ribbon-helix-helix protein, CopG family domain protein n=1 Tax=Clostridium perfringens E str. JGS1987 TaxID=451755 RepID=B1BVS4_CLOPF|nr:hypothetical protein [Clostridium perfringens]EDT14209.1 ribbon-helix-helix protein, CopG family domain protein [Clostridium perfringens E str. JGS1987]
MATKVIKDDVIRVRVTKEHKEKLKKIAKEKNTTISEILNVAIKNVIKNYKKMCKRSVATEEKIKEIKLNLAKRKLKNEKIFFL